MIYREYAPHPALRPFIECYWSAVANRPPFQKVESLIPDGTIELMFNFGDDYWQVSDNQKVKVKRSHLIGIRRTALQITQSAAQNFFSIRFKTGGTYALFNIPTYKFAQQFIGLRELLDATYGELEEQLFAANNKERVILIDQFFLKRLQSQPPVQHVSAQFFMQTAAQLEQPTIDSLASVMNMGYKKLERHFKTATGLTPRQFLKIKRFNRSVQMLYSGQFKNLTDVAYAAGYYDQAHFNRDFKQLTYQSPRQFLQAQFKIVEVIQPALAERLSKTYNF
ncbi:MAG: DUF6597 domain-containing transcriptional factor [Saprospiraceae bacterium]